MRPLSPSGPKRRRSRYYVLLIVTLAAVTLITLDARGVVALSSAREGAIDLFSPVRGAARWVTTPFRNAWNGITGYEDLQSENEQLRGEIQELRGERYADRDAAEELERLEEQLGISYLSGLDSQIARVTTGPFSNFTDHTLQLDRGRNSGLEVGMPVVQRDGLVGRITRVSDTRSVVQLITDPDMWIGIRLSRSGVIGKGHGGGDETTFIGEVSLDTGVPVEPPRAGDHRRHRALDHAAGQPDPGRHRGQGHPRRSGTRADPAGRLLGGLRPAGRRAGREVGAGVVSRRIET